MRLEAKDLSFRYHKGNRQILNHVSVSLDSSDRLGLAAPSGFGKTTFCKILAGYEQPDEGQVLLDGKPLSEYKGYCPVQLIWQHPQEAVNPRRKMKTVLEEGGVLDERLIHGLGIEKEWMERYPGQCLPAFFQTDPFFPACYLLSHFHQWVQIRNTLGNQDDLMAPQLFDPL